MTFIMVDVEANGPIPGDYSMVSFGAVVVDQNLDKTFYAQLKPISDQWVPEAMKVCGFSFEETKIFSNPRDKMQEFKAWLEESSKGGTIFISDNNGFDWQFINWYFHHFLGENPFGHSSMNLGSLYKGLVQNFKKNFKHLRKTNHTHHPVDDALGNAEALLELEKMFDISL